MKQFLMIDYKGKYFILQDKEEDMDFVCGKMSEKELTDEFLRSHITTCQYYGIPAIITKDKKLNKRIAKLKQQE